MPRETREEKRERMAEERAEAREKVFSSFVNTVNDDKKSNKVLIAAGILMVIFLITSIVLNKNDEEEVVVDNTATTEEEFVEEVETDVSTFELHDEALVGMWGSEGTERYKNADDFDGGSWIAYRFSDNGYVTIVMSDAGEGVASDRGTWNTDGNGNLMISWKNKDGSEFFSETIAYETIDNQLYMDDVEYYPITEASIFQ